VDDNIEAALDLMYQTCDNTTTPHIKQDLSADKHHFCNADSSNDMPYSSFNQQKTKKVRVTMSKRNTKGKGKRVKQLPKKKPASVKSTDLFFQKKKACTKQVLKGCEKDKNFCGLYCIKFLEMILRGLSCDKSTEQTRCETNLNTQNIIYLHKIFISVPVHCIKL